MVCARVSLPMVHCQLFFFACWGKNGGGENESTLDSIFFFFPTCKKNNWQWRLGTRLARRHAQKKKKKKKAENCRNPGSNQGPLDLQSNALPTELFRLRRVGAKFCIINSMSKIANTPVSYSNANTHFSRCTTIKESSQSVL